MADTVIAEQLTFWRRSSIRRILQGFLAVFVVIVLGVLGYVALGWTPFDALFMVVITISGVGYGEVRHMSTISERVHSMLVIALGMVAVAYTIAGFVQFLTEGEIERLLGHQRMRRQIEMLTGHTIVAGFGRVGGLVSEELALAGLSFVVIEMSLERVAEIERLGFLYIVGDATEETVLREAGIDRAQTLVTAMPSDALNVYITLTARQMNHAVMIVARAELPSTQKKLRQAGANHVVMPAAIGAHRIVSLLTNPTAVEFVELVTTRSSLAIEMDDIPVKHGSPLAGHSLRDADVGRRTGVIVIAVKRADGRVEFPPSGDEPFVHGDSIVVLGRRANLDQFRRQFSI
ncbi:MAG: potassium channel protein [Isosphaeraceae bacterium]|nr:potassium channel protein [Isosphaeraceae bacterium]